MSAQNLAAKMYLLGYDLEHDKLVEPSWLDYLVQGAALTELIGEGCLVDNGTVVSRTANAGSTDPVLTRTVDEIDAHQATSWKEMLRHTKVTYRAVEAKLARDGVIIIDGRGVTVRDRDLVQHLHAGVVDLLHGDGAATNSLEAALLPLTAVVPLRSVLSRTERRQRRNRLDLVARDIDAALPGFNGLLAQMQKTRGRSYSAGGPVH